MNEPNRTKGHGSSRPFITKSTFLTTMVLAIYFHSSFPSSMVMTVHAFAPMLYSSHNQRNMASLQSNRGHGEEEIERRSRDFLKSTGRIHQITYKKGKGKGKRNSDEGSGNISVPNRIQKLGGEPKIGTDGFDVLSKEFRNSLPNGGLIHPVMAPVKQIQDTVKKVEEVGNMVSRKIDTVKEGSGNISVPNRLQKLGGEPKIGTDGFDVLSKDFRDSLPNGGLIHPVMAPVKQIQDTVKKVEEAGNMVAKDIDTVKEGSGNISVPNRIQKLGGEPVIGTDGFDVLSKEFRNSLPNGGLVHPVMAPVKQMQDTVKKVEEVGNVVSRKIDTVKDGFEYFSKEFRDTITNGGRIHPVMAPVEKVVEEQYRKVTEKSEKASKIIPEVIQAQQSKFKSKKDKTRKNSMMENIENLREGMVSRVQNAIKAQSNEIAENRDRLQEHTKKVEGRNSIAGDGIRKMTNFDAKRRGFIKSDKSPRKVFFFQSKGNDFGDETNRIIAQNHKIIQEGLDNGKDAFDANIQKFLNGQGKQNPVLDVEVTKMRSKKRQLIGHRRINKMKTYLKSRFKNVSFQQWLIYLNVCCYILQITSAVSYVPKLNRYLSRFGYRRISASKVLEQNIWGGNPISFRLPTRRISSYGPFTTDFYFVSGKLARFQPHRFLTAGFLHGSAIHLLVNMQSLYQLPMFLEKGFGAPLYLAVYLTSIVTGNFSHDIVTGGNGTPCLGASGGICGLNGLLFTLLRKMDRDKESNVVLNNMFSMIIFGFMSSRVSNAGHIGGFVAGMIMGHFFAPNFKKSWSAKRSRWNDSDSNAQLRSFGLLKSSYGEYKSIIPLSYFYAALAFVFLTKAYIRDIPFTIIRGFLNPGRLGGVY